MGFIIYQPYQKQLMQNGYLAEMSRGAFDSVQISLLPKEDKYDKTTLAPLNSCHSTNWAQTDKLSH